MGEDDLLKALGRLERERREREQRDPWRALTEDALPVDERRELEARADRTQEGRRRRALAAPVGEDLADRLLARLAAESEAEATPSRSMGRWWRGFGLALGLTTAATLTVYVAARGDDPPLPAYAAEVLGGDAAYRGGEAAAGHALAADSFFEVKLRPEVPVDGEVALRVFVREGATLRRLDLEADPSPQGAFRIHGRVGALLGTTHPGPLELVAVVARPELLPETPAELEQALGDPATSARAGRQLFRVPLTLTTAP